MSQHFKPDPYQIKETRISPANNHKPKPDKRIEFMSLRDLWGPPDQKYGDLFTVKLRSLVNPDDVYERLNKAFGFSVKVVNLSSVDPQTPSRIYEVKLAKPVRWEEIIIVSTGALEDLVP